MNPEILKNLEIHRIKNWLQEPILMFYNEYSNWFIYRKNIKYKELSDDVVWVVIQPITKTKQPYEHKTTLSLKEFLTNNYNTYLWYQYN